MHTTLTLKDLSASRELDRAARCAVRGGLDNQANGTSQMNLQSMAAAANVGNASMILGPATIQSDNAFTQDAYNSNYVANVDFARIGIPFVH